MNSQKKYQYEGLLIAGPTASGKSAVALELAQRLNGTVINADSMQVYKDLRILTARPTEADEHKVPHQLYGFLDASETCSAARWGDLAGKAFEDVMEAGGFPIFVGGSGLYFRALIEGLSPMPEIDQSVRLASSARFDELGATAFAREVATLDPVFAAHPDRQDPQRLQRAWSVYEQTGIPLSEWQSVPREPKLSGTFLKIVLTLDRSLLRQRCNERFVRMARQGARDEVAALISRGLDPGLPIMKAIGVREFADVIAGRASEDQAVAWSQTSTRQYAKRQETWFRNQMISWKRVQAQHLERTMQEIFTNICKSA